MLLIEFCNKEVIILSNVYFGEFYYTDDKQLHDLYEVQKEYDENDRDISKYRDKMLCPECKKAKLCFTHRTSNKREYLSKIPSSNHENGCSYIHDSASKSVIIQFVNALSDENIQDKLESALNYLLPKKVKEYNEADEFEDNPFIIKMDDKKGNSINKSIPRKSINSGFDKFEENKIFIFYGRAKLKCEEFETKKGKRFKLILNIEKKNDWSKNISIYRDFIKDNINEEKIYDIAVLGYFKIYKNIPQIITSKFTSIVFRESRVETFR